MKPEIQPSAYPKARTTDEVRIFAGQALPDPFRWLEEESEEVCGWQRAQSGFAEDFIRQLLNSGR